jgi:DNA-binding MarR family transcriptional regulator
MSMGMINEEDFQVALRCTGEASPLRIARQLAKTRNDINNVLKKLEQLDIVNF